jgi:hypothetical protein
VAAPGAAAPVAKAGKAIDWDGGMEDPAAAVGLASGEVAPSSALHLAVEDGDLPSPTVNQEATGLGAAAAAARGPAGREAGALKRQKTTASSTSGTEG